MQNANCCAAIEQVLAHWGDPAQRHTAMDMALNHVRRCPLCAERMKYLVRALAAEQEDRLTCQECEDLLPEYLQAEEEGLVHGARWRPVALHLETCPHCAEEYATLSQLLELAYKEEGEEPAHYPVPDLSFLRPKQDDHLPQAWHLDALGRLIIAFSDKLLRTLQPPAYQPAYATARLRSDRPSRTLLRFELKGAVDDLEVTIEAEALRSDPDRCTVTVQIDIPSREEGLQLAGTEITLKRGEQELDTQRTNTFGEAVFEEIATTDLPHLVFEITPCT